MRPVSTMCVLICICGLALVGAGRFSPFYVKASEKIVHSDLKIATEPGGTEQDSTLALSNPDEYAWQLFFYISRQAMRGTAGVPDPSKNSFREYDPDAALVWESWALASGDNNQSEVFKCPAVKPVAWDSLPRTAANSSALVLSPNLTESVEDLQKILAGPSGQEDDLEIRINKRSFDLINDQHLWSTEGILAAAQNANASGNNAFAAFPAGAKEIKAVWVRLQNCEGNHGSDCSEKQRYHWRTIDFAGLKRVWGLAALHVTTKEVGMPNWFWADFIQEDCVHEEGACAPPDPNHRPLEPLPHDATADESGIRSETRGTKWEHYRLMGTETGFMNGTSPQLLSDPRIENQEPHATSCITCHFYASAGISRVHAVPRKPQIETLQTNGLPLIGVPKQGALTSGDSGSASARIFIQSDFSWSMLMRARSELDDCR